MYLKSIVTFLLLSVFPLIADNVGDASWYGKKFQGKLTASGEPFNMYAYTTAHRTLPFGTILVVTNLSNQKSVEVKVNDRGPAKKNRIVDLSYQAAKEIGIIEEGVGEVSIVVKKKKELSSYKQKTSQNIEKVIQRFKPSLSNPYLTDEEEKRVTEKIMGYKQKNIKSVECEEYVKELTQKSKKSVSEDIVKVQIAAFGSEVNAQNFINREKERGFRMQLLDIYSENTDQTIYKVVIICNSNYMAKKIMASNEYSGAYLFHQ